MYWKKASMFVIGLLVLAVAVLAVLSYSLLSEVRQMRNDMASLQQTVDSQSQELSQELASLQTQVEQLDTGDELTALLNSLVAAQGSQAFLLPGSVSNLLGSSWVDQEPDSVKAIRRSDYGADWPFPTNEAQIGCHGGEIIAIVGRGEFIVQSSSASLHSFMPDIAQVSLLDPSSAEMDRARQRLIDEGRSLCKVVR